MENSSIMIFLSGITAGLFSAFAIKYFSTYIEIPYLKHDNTNSKVSDEPYKMVFIIRTDLGMEKGKACAQVGHAAIGAYEKILKTNPQAIENWKKSGSTKITLKIKSEKEMETIYRKARAARIPTHITIDAGKTQIKAESKTVLALGPAPVKKIDALTQHLPLY